MTYQTSTQLPSFNTEKEVKISQHAYNYDDANTTDKIDVFVPHMPATQGSNLNASSTKWSHDFGEVVVGASKNVSVTLKGTISGDKLHIQTSHKCLTIDRNELTKAQLAAGVVIKITFTPTDVEKLFGNFTGSVGLLDEWNGLRIKITAIVK